MRKLFFLYFLPLALSLCSIYLLAHNVKMNTFLFGVKQEEALADYFRYIPNYSHRIAYENQFLRSNDSSETIYLLGSSELTNNTDGIPYNFITTHFRTKVKGLGHAGNQCFSIYSQLLANEERLKDAPIVIILSPGWFHADAANGTSSEVFLEYNSERFMNNIIRNDSSKAFTDYEIKSISGFNKSYSNPNLALKIFKFKHLSSKDILHTIFYEPIIAFDKYLLQIKLDISNKVENNEPKKVNGFRKMIVQDSIKINWDSLEVISKEATLANATNNDWGIKDSYYSQYVNGVTRKVIFYDTSRNQEFKDLKMLLNLLKTNHANASFIIMPLNIYCYTNLKELTPTINSMQNELNTYGYKCLNLWVDDPAKYEKGMLVDVMHLSDYAWYKVDKFIVDTYHLNQ